MKEVKKLDVKCDKCDKKAVTRIESSDGVPLRLCKTHEEEFAEELRERIKDKFEGMSEEEIAKEVFQKGESLL